MRNAVIVVTGGQGVLGRAVVRAFADDGARPVAVDIATGAPPEGAVLAIGGVDGADVLQARRAVERVRAEVGVPAGLVNCVGGFAWETLLDGSVETWDRLYRMNVRTAVAMCTAAVPSLVETAGAIVNVGAAAAARAAAGMGAYTAAKSGVARLTEALAEELKDRGVRVNAVLPSIIDTPANRAEMPAADYSRWVRPEALARVIRFLMSDDASAVTGAAIPVPGRV